MPKQKELSFRQLRFVMEYMKDGNGTRAAKAAGYSERSARDRVHALLSNPQIRKLIDEVKESTVAKAVYNYDAAMREVNESIELVKKEGMLMALPRLVELKFKLNGLLIDRIRIETVDVVAALKEAEARMLNGANLGIIDVSLQEQSKTVETEAEFQSDGIESELVGEFVEVD